MIIISSSQDDETACMPFCRLSLCSDFLPVISRQAPPVILPVAWGFPAVYLLPYLLSVTL
jgi:hypothetical protein